MDALRIDSGLRTGSALPTGSAHSVVVPHSVAVPRSAAVSRSAAVPRSAAASRRTPTGERGGLAARSVAAVAVLALAGSLVPLTAHADTPPGPHLVDRVAAVAPSDAAVEQLTPLVPPVPADTDVTVPAPVPADPQSQVVALDPASGEVVRVDAGSRAAAAALAAEVDALPGIVAGVSRPYAATGSIKADRLLLPPGSSLAPPASHDPSLEPRFARQWGLAWLGLPGSWAVSTGAGVTVAVLDTGVDATHPDLDARVPPGMDLVGGGSDGRVDPNGHGTFIAGIVAAALDGVGVVGVAEDAAVLPVRVLDASGSGDTASVAAGVAAAVAAGADVVNLSLGGDGPDPVLGAAVAQARAAGVVVVAAVGNEFLEGNPVEYPAAYPGVLGVTAFAPDGTSADFANTGSAVDLAAPGVDVWSDLPGGKVGAGDGTSFAAPHVAAVAALVRSVAPALTGDAVADVLMATAQDDVAGDGRDDVFGAGLVRADLALAAVGAAGLAVPGAGAPGAGVAVPPADPSAPAALPAAPASVRARLRSRSLVMRWESVAGATGYVAALRVRVPSGGSGAGSGSARWLRWWTDRVGADVVGGAWKRVRAAVVYQVRVAAVNDLGRGAWSRTATVRVR